MTTLASSLAQHGRPLLLCVAIFQFLFITVFLRDSTTTQSLSGGGSVQLRGHDGGASNTAHIVLFRLVDSLPSTFPPHNGHDADSVLFALSLLSLAANAAWSPSIWIVTSDIASTTRVMESVLRVLPPDSRPILHVIPFSHLELPLSALTSRTVDLSALRSSVHRTLRSFASLPKHVLFVTSDTLLTHPLPLEAMYRQNRTVLPATASSPILMDTALPYASFQHYSADCMASLSCIRPGVYEGEVSPFSHYTIALDKDDIVTYTSISRCVLVDGVNDMWWTLDGAGLVWSTTGISPLTHPVESVWFLLQDVLPPILTGDGKGKKLLGRTAIVTQKVIGPSPSAPQPPTPRRHQPAGKPYNPAPVNTYQGKPLTPLNFGDMK